MNNLEDFMKGIHVIEELEKLLFNGEMKDIDLEALRKAIEKIEEKYSK